MRIINSFKKGFGYTEEERMMVHARELLDTELMVRRQIRVKYRMDTEQTMKDLDRQIPGKMLRTIRGCRQIVSDILGPRR